MRYKQNARLLLWMAPFRALALSAAYLVPFFQLHNLSHTEFFLVQALFSLTVMAWEIPSGYLADRFGRALCIKLSAPIAAISMIAYGFSTEFWQFVLCEVVLGIANGLLSGADTSLLYDSMRADGKTEAEFEKRSKRINALGFVAPVVVLPLAVWVVGTFGIGAAIVCDGIAALLCVPIAMRLGEPPIHFAKAKSPKRFREAGADIHALFMQRHVRLLVLLTVSLGTATYMGAWLSAETYLELGIPLELFAILLAGRQLWKAAWAQWYHPVRWIGQHMAGYTALSVAGLAGMASFSWIGAPLMLGLDAVHAQQGPAIIARLNRYMPGLQRATLNSAINMVQRLSFALVGLTAGAIADVAGLRTTLLVLAVGCGIGALYALYGLRGTQALAQG